MAVLALTVATFIYVRKGQGMPAALLKEFHVD
jgi:hypothetical protein